MSPQKIVMIVNVLDNADVLDEQIDWYLTLGVDLVLAWDYGSVDGSQRILEHWSRTNRVKWWINREKNIEHYDPTAKLARIARDEHGADWIIQCDTDEFLCGAGGTVRSVLGRTADDVSVLSVTRFNMTGPPLADGQSALEASTWRIDRGVDTTVEQRLSGALPRPSILNLAGYKTIVRAAAFEEYTPGAHSARATWGRTEETSELHILHYPVRGFAAFEAKVRNAIDWFRENPHLESQPMWAWHWRRLIRLYHDGRLREEYDRQFLTKAQAEALLADGTCSVDESVAHWVKRRRRHVS